MTQIRACLAARSVRAVFLTGLILRRLSPCCSQFVHSCCASDYVHVYSADIHIIQ
jgi:hypothetical protein